MKLTASITNIAYHLPETIVANDNARLCKKMGIFRRHIVAPQETAADLAVVAAEKLFAQGIQRDSIDFVLLCTQSPDYILPTTACILQHRLSLSTGSGALDFNLGCSGYIYGLSLAKGLIETRQAGRVLLLTAETYSKFIHPKDNAVLPVFGDAATATLVEGIQASDSKISHFVFGTDGAGAKHLMIPVGGARYSSETTDVVETEDEFGNIRTNRNLFMNGAAIAEFVLNVIPPLIEDILQKAKLTPEEIDYFVFHQANRFVLQYLQQKCGLLERPFWIDMEEYANTVSCSIPIALTDMLRQNQNLPLSHVLLAGFGVGLSWGGCLVDLTEVKF